jgi:hypothetical protein
MRKILLAVDKDNNKVEVGNTIFDEFNDYIVLEILKKNCAKVKYVGYVENKEGIINTKKCFLDEEELELKNKRKLIDIIEDARADVTFNGEMLYI